MATWQHLLSDSPVGWLLEKENPSVRYFTLRDLLDRRETDSELQDARAAIPSSTIMKKLFSKQKREGYWEDPRSPYVPKYKSTYWQIMILGQLGMNKSDERARKACEFILRLQLSEGGFSAYTARQALEKYEWMRSRTALKENLQPEPQAWTESLVREHQYSCLTGNVTAAFLRMGYGGDSRITNALNWLVEIQNTDGGWLCPYWKAHIRDTHGCFYGTICPLEAFSEIPEPLRSALMHHAIEKAAEFMLMHRLYKADHHGYRVINQQWLKFTFPWFYGYNILRGLTVLTKLGYVNDERLVDAAKVLVRKRRSDGTWVLEGAPTGRMQTNIEAVGKPSKWITLNALRVMKRLYQTKNIKLRSALQT